MSRKGRLTTKGKHALILALTIAAMCDRNAVFPVIICAV